MTAIRLRRRHNRDHDNTFTEQSCAATSHGHDLKATVQAIRSRFSLESLKEPTVENG